jgi:hypothetical protein
MATGDILSCTIDTDGWWATVIIEGFVDEGTYDYGLGANNDPTDAKVVFTVVSEGYNSAGTLGTTTRTVYGTRTLRKAYPNHAVLDETENGGNLEIKVALSEFIYDDDNTGAGKSGTAPTVTIGADWYTDDGTGGSSNGNNATTDLTCTNNSTLDYPKVIGRWDNLAGAMAGDRVTAAFKMACLAVHKFGIAAVRFDADGQTSLNNENETVTSTESEAYSVSGLRREFYRTANVSLTSFTDDELIDLRFRAYPVVGDADSLLDTDDVTAAASECLGYAKATIVCNKDDDGDLYAFVDGTGPDPGTVSATLATAQADPYATIGQAIADGANVIYLTAGTHEALGDNPAARVTTDEWVIVQPAPGVSKASAICQISEEGVIGDRAYRCERLRYHNLSMTIENAADSYLWGEGVNFLRFTNCTFDSSNYSGKPTIGPGMGSLATYYHNCDGDISTDNWHLTGFGVNNICYVFEGTKINGTAGSAHGSNATYAMVGCLVDKHFSLQEVLDGNGGPQALGVMYAYNKWVDIDNSGSVGFTAGNGGGTGYANTLGMAFINNVIEVSNISTNAFATVASSTTGVDFNNFILWNNIIMGSRCLFGYNDTVAADRLNWSMIGNVIHSWNNKGDDDNTDGTLIGGWPVDYNVGTNGSIFWGSNRVDILDNQFRGEFDGLKSIWGTQPTFQDDQSSQASAGGNGDYRPLADSPQINLVTVLRQTYDNNGVTKEDPAESGAYEYVLSGGDTRNRSRYLDFYRGRYGGPS